MNIWLALFVGWTLHGIAFLLLLSAMLKASRSPALPPLIEPEDLQDTPGQSLFLPGQGRSLPHSGGKKTPVDKIENCPVCGNVGTLRHDSEIIWQCENKDCRVLNFWNETGWHCTEHGLAYRTGIGAD